MRRPIFFLLAAALAAAALVGSSGAAAAGGIPQRAYAYQRLLMRCAHASPWGLAAPLAVLAAQVHAESLWAEGARSWCGAEGLAQFMPSTAEWISDLRGLGEARPYNPGWGLRALAEYDHHLYRRAHAATECDRWAFTLSAYNGGEGWRRRDQRLAAERGLDPLIWWANVEIVNAGRRISAWRENRNYPRKILLRFTPMYEAAGWGRGVPCREVSP